MNNAKDCVRTRLRWTMAKLALCICFLVSGCTGLSGLRSVGTGKPLWFGHWDHSQQPPSPSPENDYYAQRMREGSPPSTDSHAAKSAEPSRGVASADEPGEQIAGATSLSGSAKGSSLTEGPEGEGSLRVTLGRPEPLPGLLSAAPAHESPAANGPSTPWRTGGTQPAEGDGPGLAQPTERDLHENEPSRVADRGQRPATVDAKAVLAQAEAKLQALDTYEVKFSRVERVGGELQPEEDIHLSVRREPKAVRLEWSSGPNKGREVIYSTSIDPRLIFVHLATGAIPLPAMKIPVDSPLVMKNSRHAITEAGFDTVIENLRHAVGGNDKNQTDGGTLEYKGMEKPPGFDRSCHHFVRHSPSHETWNVYLDADSMMPTLVLAENSQGELMERYVYRSVRDNPTELASSGAFEPEKRWGESKGLLSRFARATANSGLPSARESTTR
jgi:hypothetical protein